MPNAISYPFYGGARHSPASAELKIILPNTQFILGGWQKISYSWELAPEMVYGNHPDPVGQTLGQAKYEAELELLLAEYNFLLASIGPGFATIPFQLTISHTENGFDTIVDSIYGARIKGGSADIQIGAAPQKRTVPLSPLKIKPNGVDLLAVPLQGVAA